MKGRNLGRVLSAVVGFMALVGVGAASTHYLYEPANEGFLEFPTIVFLDVVFGGLYLAFADFQFVGRGLRAAAGVGRAVPGLALPLPRGHRGVAPGPGWQPDPPAADVRRGATLRPACPDVASRAVVPKAVAWMAPREQVRQRRDGSYETPVQGPVAPTAGGRR